jgi:hypothetical protein
MEIGGNGSAASDFNICAGQLSLHSDGLRAELQAFDPPQRADIFLYSTGSRPNLGPFKPPI